MAVTQREIVTDTESYEAGIRAALRQAPDVILWEKCGIKRRFKLPWPHTVSMIFDFLDIVKKIDAG